ncbi:hypothetical protein BpHYR1_007687 [Brachionus plicatilis]|uniref:Uncharacterized protein n=1 Tax=Brachionus plicatilis TaxID=10195 RepID=A0A3M7SPG3_BRAPC|nr:hypothetical protein BpHYR1_007687 [Brachionus plicatilis]
MRFKARLIQNFMALSYFADLQAYCGNLIQYDYDAAFSVAVIFTLKNIQSINNKKQIDEFTFLHSVYCEVQIQKKILQHSGTYFVGPFLPKIIFLVQKRTFNFNSSKKEESLFNLKEI